MNELEGVRVYWKNACVKRLCVFRTYLGSLGEIMTNPRNQGKYS
jgi:hypothetical protein